MCSILKFNCQKVTLIEKFFEFSLDLLNQEKKVNGCHENWTKVTNFYFNNIKKYEKAGYSGQLLWTT